MLTVTLSEREQWAASTLTKKLKEALKAQKEVLKEAWATGTFVDVTVEYKALGAIENIDSTIEAINDLSKEEVKDGGEDKMQSGGTQSTY